MNLRSDKVEISLKDVFSFLLLHIRSTIIISLVVGLLFAGYKAYNAYKGAVAQNALAAQQEEEEKASIGENSTETAASGDEDSEKDSIDFEAIDNMTDQEFLSKYGSTVGNSERTTHVYIDMIKQHLRERDYFDNTDLMKLDASNVPTTEADFVISLSEVPSTGSGYALLKEYESEIEDPDFLKETAKKYGYNEKYFSEMISFSPAITDDTSLISDNEKLLLKVYVFGFSEDDTKNVMEDIKSRLPEVTAITNAISGNTISLVSEKTYTASSSYIKAAQENIISVYYKSSDTANYAAQGVANALIGGYTVESGASDKVSTVDTGAVTGTAFKKSFVSGFFVTFILIWILLIIIYNVAAPLTRFKFFAIFNFRELGSLRDGLKALYRHNTGFDKALRHSMSLEDEKDIDKASDMVMSNLSVYTPEKKKYLVIDFSIYSKGNNDDAFATKLAETLSSKSDDMKFMPSGDIINNAKNRKKLTENEAVIFCAEYGHLKNDYINDVYSIVSSSGLEMAGIVLR